MSGAWDKDQMFIFYLLHHSVSRHHSRSVVKRVFPGGSDSKESACNGKDSGSIPGLGRSPGEGNGLPTPVFLPEEFHGQSILMGYGPWGH